ncbi:UDP-glucose dehydrogenase family protein [Selenomonas ruminantium]|uniref:UDP-glucose dehydrogenase family protein n=1 Tax=Selenomonas ruminantium TaxID=971 RepID=UPI000410E8D9|nr:UDP-glucose/GDP-mannose dehydrogenase family protein [Selenomonas ruminantium]
MKITIVGTGYVGLVTGTCFAEMGNMVWCVDIDDKKISMLKNGDIPIFEPGLKEMVVENCARGHLHFTTSIEEALQHTNICFIAVGTPMRKDRSADLSYVENVARDIGKYMVHHMFVVDKSTVPVGTARKVRVWIQEELDHRENNLTFDVISNPEFLKEGAAVSDCMKPDRVVIGVDNDEAQEVMKALYRVHVKNTENFIVMDIPSAEMTKYAANAMLATKISFMNEIAGICERVGADVNKVRLGIGSDTRIGYSFIYPGCGYGGSCFPKDIQALIQTSMEYDYEPNILNAVELVNERQKMVLPEKIVQIFGENLSERCFAVWGLSFKPDTDDMRESPAINIIKELVRRGANIVAYDPKAIVEAQTYYLVDMPKVSYADSKYEALKGADALILITEWKEFRQPDFEEIVKLLKQPLIFDGRNQYDKNRLAKYGIEYHQIGVA